MASLTPENRKRLGKAIMMLKLKQNQRKLWDLFPDEGEYRRELYHKHGLFFEAGSHTRERCFLAANRVGKTVVGLYEVALHLIGEYPSWWKGRRFTKATKWWACGDTAKTVRDILQDKLLGPPGGLGTGLIPGDNIIKVTRKLGVSEAVETVHVRSVYGTSQLTLKSYDQRREAFQGTEQDGVLLDEEPPMDIYTECLIRTMTTDGLVILTFTPLMGLTEVVQTFMPGGKLPDGENKESKWIIQATWDDVPHLSSKQKEELWNSIPPYQRDARSRGIPQLGSGAIYPVPESELVIAPIEIPMHWLKVYGMDVGWNRTAALWGAYDPDGKVLYLYSEYYKGQAEPPIHAEAIRSRGEWIPGVIDPASRGRAQQDGKQLSQVYINYGLQLSFADNAVESGMLEVWNMMSSGRLKIFSNLVNLLEEFRMYRRDSNGNVVKEKDHLMDCMRYLVRSGIKIARPSYYEEEDYASGSEVHVGTSSGNTGY